MNKLLLPLLTLALLGGTTAASAQNNVGIGTNAANPAASAVLDVSSTTQGLLAPRMTQAQRNAIASPATGLLVYQTDSTPGFYFFSGTAWTAVAGSGGTGSQGPAGTNGTNGTNGLNALVRTTPEAAGANCATGGTRLDAGLDANSNGTLDAAEINAALTRYVCNGAAGQQGTAGTNGTNGTNGATGPQGPAGPGVPAGGTDGQVLTKTGSADYATQWSTLSAGGGATTLLVATKATGSQVLSLANGTNIGDPIAFDNTTVSPTTGVGSYDATTGIYTVGTSGAGTYLIQARAIAMDNAANTSLTIGSWIYIEVNGSGVGSPNNVYPSYIGSSPTNLPAGMRSNPGFVSGVIRLAVGNTFRIKGLGANSSTSPQTLKTDGSCNLTVMKLN